MKFKSDYDGRDVEFELDLHYFKYSTGTSGNKKITSPLLNQLYISMMQDASNMKELIKIYFYRFNDGLKTYYNEFTNAINYVSNVDILFTKSFLAIDYNYCKPVLDSNNSDNINTIDNNSKSYFDCKGIRHPIIETILTNTLYVTNDVIMGNNNNDGILLFGTNSCGKSSLMKAIGLCVIMSQAGL